VITMPAMPAVPAVPRIPVWAMRRLVRFPAHWIYAPDTTWEQRRRRVHLVALTQFVPRGTAVETIVVGDVPAERLSNSGADRRTVLLYLHGGGFATGSPQTHRGLAARLAASMGAVAVVPAYRLAPEHPYPAALDDVLAVYRALLEDGHEARRIVIAGDSAGGTLALGLALAARSEGLPLPAALALICPSLDLTRTGFPVAGRREPVLTEALMTEFIGAYTSPDQRRDPLVSPLLADLHGLPPILIESASDDPLAADALLVTDKARAAGVRVQHQHHAGLWHAFHILGPLLAEAEAATTALALALAAELKQAVTTGRRSS
jgi:monoterpene epsilon-lactone hydrolase